MVYFEQGGVATRLSCGGDYITLLLLRNNIGQVLQNLCASVTKQCDLVPAKGR